VNVDAEPAAFEELRRVGVNLVPAVVLGDRAAHGWNPPAYAALLGIDYRPAEKLAPATLAARLDRVLAAVETLLAALPDDRFGWKPPERDRSIGDLGFHVFRLALAFVDAMDLGRFPESWLQEHVPPEMPDGPAVARYGALVRARLAGWFQGAAPAEYARTIAVYYGPQSGHDLLERTTWHAAQHVRQLYDLYQRLALTAPVPIPSETFAGLPLPHALW
jgi:hypothetical protein